MLIANLTPNDPSAGELNRQAVMAALAQLPLADRTLEFPAGVYYFDNDPDPTIDAALKLYGVTGLRIVGQGAGQTVLKIIPGAYPLNHDRHLFRLKDAKHILFEHFTIDGSFTEILALLNGNNAGVPEQMHGIRVLNSEQVTVRHVYFFNICGDGIFLIGDNGVTRHITVDHCAFDLSNRSGIANQRNCFQLRFLNNSFTRIKNSCIDIEPTGSNVTLSDVWIERNHVDNPTLSYAFGFGTSPASPVTGVCLRDNIIRGCGISLYRLADSEVIGNRVYPGLHNPRPALELRGVTDVRVVGNTFACESPVEAVVKVNRLSVPPAGLSFTDNVIRAASGKGIYLEAARGPLLFAGNRLYGPSGANPAHHGIGLRQTVSDGVLCKSVTLAYNMFFNWPVGVKFSTITGSQGFDLLSIAHNHHLWDGTLPTPAPKALLEEANGVTPFLSRCLHTANIAGEGIL